MLGLLEILLKRKTNPKKSSKPVLAATQIERVRDVLRDGEWKTLEEVSSITGDTTPSISARLRDLRKPRFGNHLIIKRKVNDNLFEYRMVRGEQREQL